MADIIILSTDKDAKEFLYPMYVIMIDGRYFYRMDRKRIYTAFSRWGAKLFRVQGEANEVVRRLEQRGKVCTIVQMHMV